MIVETGMGQNPVSNAEFAKIVDENIALLRKTVFRVVLNEQDADDIVQETFMTAYEKIDSFSGNSKISTWLCRIAFNKAFSSLRKRNGFQSDIDDEQHLRDNKSMAPDRKIISDETHSMISSAMAELPEMLRAAITLVTIDDVPPETAAYMLGCNRATLYWRIHKARKILQQKLGHLL